MLDPMTQLLNMVTEPHTYQPKDGMGGKIIDYLVGAHYDTNWEGFSEGEQEAYRSLAKDIIIALENDLL